MFILLACIFIILPIVEIYLFIKVGSVIGGLNTIALIIATGILGAALAKSQGRFVLMQIQNSLNKGNMPADALLHGLLVLVGGILLITPGFATDILGLLLVLPLTRFWVLRSLKRFIRGKMTTHGQGNFFFFSNLSANSEFRNNKRNDTIIDAKFETLE